MSDEEEPSKLIQFKPRSEAPERDSAEPLIRKKPNLKSDCQHKYTEIDEVLRTVECADCHVFLDPIEVLLRFVKFYSDRDYKYQKIMEFEEKERKAAERRRQRRT